MHDKVDQKLKNRAIHRAKIIRGQLDGLVKAIEKEEDCPTLLEQSRSIERSLKSLESFLLENHLRSHVKSKMQTKGEDEIAIKELIRIYTLSNK
jgi:DNA-binding FrmR family transcriptional regulator